MRRSMRAKVWVLAIVLAIMVPVCAWGYYDWGEIAHNIQYRDLKIVFLDTDFAYVTGEILNKRSQPVSFSAQIVFQEAVGNKVIIKAPVYDIYVPANGSAKFKSLTVWGPWQEAKDAYKVVWFVRGLQ